ncbi:MAG: hypothetical protein HC900_13720 [Methylacidiphilales bacterium]|nr:hypothetical protein [Candidatus Methylacidiphilales bacterium]
MLIRQRPGSAKGVMFITIEDVTGIANLVWQSVCERERRTILAASLLSVEGIIQREGAALERPRRRNGLSSSMRFNLPGPGAARNRRCAESMTKTGSSPKMLSCGRRHQTKPADVRWLGWDDPCLRSLSGRRPLPQLNLRARIRFPALREMPHGRLAMHAANCRLS